MEGVGSVWARRFIVTALIQGTIMFVLTELLLYADFPFSGFVSPENIVAQGSAGTWFTVGYLGYLIVPVVGTGLSALFYHYLEVVMGRPYEKGLRYLAWGHLLLGNVVLAAGIGLLMYGGYVGGSQLFHPTLNCPAPATISSCVHDQILGPLVPVISTLFIVGSLGPLLGGIGYAVQFRRAAGTHAA